MSFEFRSQSGAPAQPGIKFTSHIWSSVEGGVILRVSGSWNKSHIRVRVSTHSTGAEGKGFDLHLAVFCYPTLSAFFFFFTPYSKMRIFYSNYSRKIWVELWFGLGNLIFQNVETCSLVWHTPDLKLWYTGIQRRWPGGYGFKQGCVVLIYHRWNTQGCTELMQHHGNHYFVRFSSRQQPQASHINHSLFISS